MPAPELDHNALLLQVMAHDLLAPLTAIKWQTELLAKIPAGSQKYWTYLESMNNSTLLGITLTKHAHVAGKVLTHSYVQDATTVLLSNVIRTGVENMALQYERHGLLFEVDLHDEKEERTLDEALTKLFMWGVAKFFLTCTPANSTVTVRGLPAKGPSGEPLYTVAVSAPDIPERDECVELFRAVKARDQFDQVFIFSKLIHEVAHLLSVDVEAHTQANLLVVEATFGSA